MSKFVILDFTATPTRVSLDCEVSYSSKNTTQKYAKYNNNHRMHRHTT